MERWLIPWLMVVLFAAGAHAEDRIWAALVLGTTENPPRPAPEELEPFVKGLRTVFGYNSFYLLAAKEKKIRKGTEEWVVPNKKVFLKLQCIDRSPGCYTVNLELYFKKELLVTSQVKFARDAPLYIRGPNWGKGRLIYILEVR
jgi:hypothetical protein